jgi:transcriptional regulator with XRE-family HTH domain
MLTPSQLVAARGIIGWSVVDLAAASGTSRYTITAFESGGSNPTLKTLQAWIGTLHKAGIVLLDEDEAHGPGVRLRKGAVVPAPVEVPPGATKANGKATSKA